MILHLGPRTPNTRATASLEEKLNDAVRALSSDLKSEVRGAFMRNAHRSVPMAQWREILNALKLARESAEYVEYLKDTIKFRGATIKVRVPMPLTLRQALESKDLLYRLSRSRM